MSRRQTRKKKSSSARLVVELAIFGTLALHLLLFYGFRLNRQKQGQVGGVEEPDTLLLTTEPEINSWTEWREFLKQSQAVPKWEKEIFGWCLWADPTLLTLPNEEYGFAELRKYERELSVQSVPGYGIEVEQTAEQKFSQFNLSKQRQPLEKKISAGWQTAKLPKSEVTVPTPLERKIIWRYLDGTLVQQPLTLDAEKVQKAVEIGGKPESPTRIELNHEGKFTRIIVRRSSGNLQLDKLLVQRLTLELFAHEQALELAKNTTEHRLFPPEEEVSVFEVEWRLLYSNENAFPKEAGS